MVERVGEMRNGRRERIERGDRERDKKTGPERHPLLEFLDRPCDIAIVSSSPQGMTSWSSSIKIWFLQGYRMHY